MTTLNSRNILRGDRRTNPADQERNRQGISEPTEG